MRPRRPSLKRLGIGASRSQGFGRYVVTEWTEIKK